MPLKTVTSYILPTDAHIARAKLETEGIKVFLKDELTVQTDNFLSNAIGGVKIQVSEEDYEIAREILLESQLMVEIKQTKNKYLTVINGFTSNLPIIGKWIFEIRLLFIVGVILLLFLLLFFNSTL